MTLESMIKMIEAYWHYVWELDEEMRELSAPLRFL
jgi:hypothetical protein